MTKLELCKKCDYPLTWHDSKNPCMLNVGKVLGQYT